MAKLVWDKIGERFYETGIKRVCFIHKDLEVLIRKVLRVNGLISVTENPSGAEVTPIYADNIKYVNLISAEEFGATIEAYTYPDEFAQCDGSAEIAKGVMIGQQSRKPLVFLMLLLSATMSMAMITAIRFISFMALLHLLQRRVIQLSMIAQKLLLSLGKSLLLLLK